MDTEQTESCAQLNLAALSWCPSSCFPRPFSLQVRKLFSGEITNVHLHCSNKQSSGLSPDTAEFRGARGAWKPQKHSVKSVALLCGCKSRVFLPTRAWDSAAAKAEPSSCLRAGGAFDVRQTKHFLKNIHNTFSRQKKYPTPTLSDNLFEVFHINLERQEIGRFDIDGSSSGNVVWGQWIMKDVNAPYSKGELLLAVCFASLNISSATEIKKKNGHIFPVILQETLGQGWFLSPGFLWFWSGAEISGGCRGAGMGRGEESQHSRDTAA